MATINKAENSLEDKLVNTVSEHDRAIREIKSARQPIGADILKVSSPTAVLSLGPLTLVAGDAGTFVLTFFPGEDILTLWNFAHTAYVDFLDTAHQFPAGASLTSSSRKVRVTAWLDWADSDDTTNSRAFKVRFENYDTVTHSYYVRFRAYLPVLAGVTDV